MLSRERAIVFLREGLQIQEVERKLENDRLLLLREILRNHVAKVPYQNFMLLAQDHSTRRVPSFEQMVEDCLALNGGTCSVLNIFFSLLLKALGYDAVIQGTIVNKFPDIPNHHLVNIVRGVETKDDVYLCDPAAWYPSYEVIPLHTITESSPVYRNAFIEYKFDKDGDIITRLTRKAKITLFTPKEEDDDWKAFYNFSLKIQDQKDVLAGIQRTYDERTSGCLYAFSFSLHPIGQAVTLNGYTLRIFDEEMLNKITKELKDLDEVCDALRPFWKGIDKNVVLKATDHLPQPECKKT